MAITALIQIYVGITLLKRGEREKKDRLDEKKTVYQENELVQERFCHM